MWNDSKLAMYKYGTHGTQAQILIIPTIIFPILIFPVEGQKHCPKSKLRPGTTSEISKVELEKSTHNLPTTWNSNLDQLIQNGNILND